MKKSKDKNNEELAGGWISIDKQLPPSDENFLGYNKEWIDPTYPAYNRTGVRICRRAPRYDARLDRDLEYASADWAGSRELYKSDPYYSPTHWCPIPSLPTEI